MWVWLKLKLTPRGDHTKTWHFLSLSLCTDLSDTWKGKYSNFPSRTPSVRPKSAIHTPKRDDKHPRHFYNGVTPPPPPPPPPGYLTIIPWAHEAEGRMGYWLRGHDGKRNNCFSKIKLVGQKYRDKTTLASKTRFSRHCFGFQSRRFSLLVGYNIQPSSSSTDQNAALIIDR